MNLQEYIDSKSKMKPNADIVERWKTRIVARGLSGALGAREYLRDYGKGIAAPKVIMLAKQATNMGDLLMADAFWRFAFKLEIGHEPAGEGASEVAVGKVKAEQNESCADFPTNLQPGRVAPMQPVDGLETRETYAQYANYWGQPKRDGNKLLLFATPGSAWYQSRQLNLRTSPSETLENALMDVALVRGSFILEGELYYLDMNDMEHRTGAQAATVNIAAGCGHIQPQMRFMTFSALFADGADLTGATYAERVNAGYILSQALTQKAPEIFETVVTAKTFAEKMDLIHTQKSQGREGEIWFDIRLAYQPGKPKHDVFVRTKYMSEFNAIVTCLTKTTAQGRLFKAIEVTDMRGKPIGNIGTGFDRETQQKIVERFDAARVAGKDYVIPVVSQGFTEGGIMFLARLSEEFS